MPAPTTILVLGGARSGKSRYAESRVTTLPRPWVYVATAAADDNEMRARIAEHRRRRGPQWETVEEPLDLLAALRDRRGAGGTALVDCLTLWLSNLMHAGRDVAAEGARLAAALEGLDRSVVFVSNEVGLGIVPDNPLARAFRDHAGRLHQALAEHCREAVFVAAGLPLWLKEPTGEDR